MQARELAAIDEVAAGDWNRLAGADCPFLRHEFLAALEHSGCVGGDTGWTPAHLTLFDGARLVAAAPAYRKTHSWGEFVFDFGWAEAYQRHGLAYYPKLVLAVPFSPINAARLLTDPDLPAEPLRAALVREAMDSCALEGLSSAHALFISSQEMQACTAHGWLIRDDVQFHWHNRGYRSFDEYLATFRADKRKQIRRERRRVAEEGIHFVTRHGSDISPAELRFAYEVHARNFYLHGHEPYLNYACFGLLAQHLPEALMVKIAMQDETPVAAAVFISGAGTLYGRYWGAVGDFHSLHFETCYHQGIEYCIERGIGRFEPGTQGEHKIVRGFEPTTCHSAHHIAHPRFREAIAEFLEREKAAVADYSQAAAAHVPFRRA